MEKRTAKGDKLPPGFCTYFSNLLSCPPSLASIERMFFSLSFVWTKLRNKPGVVKAGNLVQMHSYLRKNNDVDDDEER